MIVETAALPRMEDGARRQSAHERACALPVDTLAARLTFYAAEMPNTPAYRFLAPDASHTTLTYHALHEKSVTLAHRMAAAGAVPGQPVAIVIEPSLHFVVAFFACILGGYTAVPLPRPRTDAARTRLIQALSHVTPDVILTTKTTQPSLNDDMLGTAILVDEKVELTGAGAVPEHHQDVALLQLTSGSTGKPKAVVVTHANLLAMRKTLDATLPHGRPFSTMSWLPLEHDMGLIGGMLQAFWSGNLILLMAPESFMARPMRWLRAISDHRVDVTVATNSAYQRTIDLSSSNACTDLDLSCLKVAFCGAEPLRAETIEAFCTTFAAQGFDRTSLSPCYGLAEATLLVAGVAPKTAPRIFTASRKSLALGRAAEAGQEAGVKLLSSGQVATNVDLKIVDPDQITPLPEQHIGEIWVSGPTVASGYVNNPAASQETFCARLPDNTADYLRTGDLGFLYDGHLYVTGRIETRIIRHGRTFHAADFERTARHAHETLRPDRVAIIQNGDDGAIVAICEIRTQATKDAARALWGAIVRDTGVAIDRVQLVKGSSLLWTTSGKLRRQASRQRCIVEPDLICLDWQPPESDRALERVSAMLAETPRVVANIEKALCVWVAAQGDVDLTEIDPELPWADQYVDSLRAAELVTLLEGVFDIRIDSDLLFDHPSPGALAPILYRMLA
jgi:acyl-CoA synthetase (AMP-forming)/AMP-acid ligase II/acyl carrier protein